MWLGFSDFIFYWGYQNNGEPVSLMLSVCSRHSIFSKSYDSTVRFWYLDEIADITLLDADWTENKELQDLKHNKVVCLTM